MMAIVWTMVGALAMVASGIFLYRWGVYDGVAICKRATRAKLAAARKNERPAVMPDEQTVRQWREMINFMQYDGGEMPRADGGDRV